MSLYHWMSAKLQALLFAGRGNAVWSHGSYLKSTCNLQDCQISPPCYRYFYLYVIMCQFTCYWTAVIKMSTWCYLKKETNKIYPIYFTNSYLLICVFSILWWMSVCFVLICSIQLENLGLFPVGFCAAWKFLVYKCTKIGNCEFVFVHFFLLHLHLSLTFFSHMCK